jgi:hypothetical protein
MQNTFSTRINLPGTHSAAREARLFRPELLYPRGHEAPRRMRDVDARTLARPLLAWITVTA